MSETRIMTFGPVQNLYRAAKEFLDLHGSDSSLNLSALVDAVKEIEGVAAERTEYAGHIEAAREITTDDLEIDDDPVLSVAENGVWVSGWIWVENSQETEAAGLAVKLGLEKEAAAKLLQAMFDRHGIDWDDFCEGLCLDVLTAAELVSYLDSTGRAIGAEAGEILADAATGKIVLLSNDGKDNRLLVAAQMSWQQADDFAKACADNQFTRYTLKVKGWVCFSN